MDDAKILALLGGLTLLVFLIFFGATVVWACWDSIHTIFPTANQDLGIPRELSWWTSVKFTFLVTTLFKATKVQTTSK